jgi:hypothetical protein
MAPWFHFGSRNVVLNRPAEEWFILTQTDAKEKSGKKKIHRKASAFAKSNGLRQTIAFYRYFRKTW